MCLCSFIVELNIWRKKKSMNLGLWRPRIIFSMQRNISKSHIDWDASVLVIPVWLTQQDPQRCHTDASWEGYVSMLAAHVSPHHVIGKAKAGGGTAAMPSLQPQDMIQPDGTSDDSLLQPGNTEQFSIRVHTSPPCPHRGRKPGQRGNHRTVVHRRAIYPLSRERPREQNKWMNSRPMLSTTPALLKPMRRVSKRSKKQLVLGWMFVTQWKVVSCLQTFKVEPNFSNQMSRLNLPSQDRVEGNLCLQKETGQKSSWDNTACYKVEDMQKTNAFHIIPPQIRLCSQQLGEKDILLETEARVIQIQPMLAEMWSI